MGIIDNFIQRIATEVVKAGNISDLSSMTRQQTSGYNSTGLPREDQLATVPFAPGRPIIPGAINPLREDGRPDPRRYEFQVAQNINVTETRLVPFKTLRTAADSIDILRRCIEVLKSKMASLEWDIVFSEDTVDSVAAEENISNLRAQQLAKEKFGEEIAKAKLFWKTPDQANGLIFSDWLNMALEDVLVLDAWAVWPQKTVGGDLFGLQVLDGGTIKPLIDDRGMRPLPPNAAFQQILYGFPRSEFAAPDETEDADGEFSADELSYMVRNKRTTSVYGYGPVERSLALADLYLRRQQWLRAEYTDGVLPELMFKTDANFGNNPDLLRAYENIFNDDLAGQTEQRKRARLLPGGIEPIQFEGYGERFKETLDDYLVHSICGHFGVMPSEIGFTPKSGLGGAGHQAGEGISSEVIGLLPLSQWLGRMLSQLSYVYLGMPRELEFKFMDSARNDAGAEAQADDIRLRNGTMAINESRAKAGLPLLEAEEADTPIFIGGAGAYFVTENGMMDVASGGQTDVTQEGAVPVDASTDAPVEEKPAEEKPASKENAPVEDEESEKGVNAHKRKFNENHDESGRFASGDGASTSNPYEGAHDAPDSHSDVSVNIPNLEQNMPNIFDKDKARQYYGTGNDKVDAESFRVLHSLTGDPDQMVTIYRGVPEGATTINNGDWVTLSRAYAEQHIESNLNGGGHVISDTARVGDLWSDGDSVNEFGLDRAGRGVADGGQSKAASIDETVNETKRFLKWVRKSPSRAFEFKHLPVSYAETLNKFVAIQDFDGARWYAERYLP